MKKISWLLCITGLLALNACGDDDDSMAGVDGGPDATADAAADQTIAEIVSSDDRFSTLAGALTQAELVSTFEGEGPFTVFAPTNDAFALLPDGLVAGLDAATLDAVLKYHVIGAAVPASAALETDSATTLAEIDIALNVSGETLYINGLTAVIETDIAASNGVIHVIDSVLIPATSQGHSLTSSAPTLGLAPLAEQRAKM